MAKALHYLSCPSQCCYFRLLVLAGINVGEEEWREIGKEINFMRWRGRRQCRWLLLWCKGQAIFSFSFWLASCYMPVVCYFLWNSLIFSSITWKGLSLSPTAFTFLWGFLESWEKGTLHVRTHAHTRICTGYPPPAVMVVEWCFIQKEEKESTLSCGWGFDGINVMIKMKAIAVLHDCVFRMSNRVPCALLQSSAIIVLGTF
jgi:hypothetical protein